MTTGWGALPQFYRNRAKEALARHANMNCASSWRCRARIGRHCLGRQRVPRCFGGRKTELHLLGRIQRPSHHRTLRDKHDVKVEFDFITDSAGAFAKLAAGAWRSFDVISSDVPWIQRMGQAGIVKYLPDRGNGRPQCRTFRSVQATFHPLLHEGQTCGIPTRRGISGSLTYDSRPDSPYGPCFRSSRSRMRKIRVE